MNTFQTIDDCLLGLQTRKVADDPNDILSWMFEYACKTCEYEGIDPTKATKYMEKRMLEKLRLACFAADQIYQTTPNLKPYKLNLSYEIIEDLVRKEHGLNYRRRLL